MVTGVMRRTPLQRWIGKETDLWHVGIAPMPIAEFLQARETNPIAIRWLPRPRDFAFIADPFGLTDETGTTTLFVEALDYRIKRGEIHYYELNQAGRVTRHGVALAAKTHLSYPFIIRDENTIYMLPEAHRSGKLTLYRAQQFPEQWEPVVTLLDLPAIDASPIHYQGRWWMFFALPGENGRALNELHIAYADQLTGPWTLHAGNPVRTGLDSSRMGGTPFIHEGALYLPMQDCTKTYGGAMNLLRVEQLSPHEFRASIAHHLAPNLLQGDFPDGMHTLAACGNVTLVDAKRISCSPIRRVIDTERRIRRLMGLSA